jgi:hypothetical protein
MYKAVNQIIREIALPVASNSAMTVRTEYSETAYGPYRRSDIADELWKCREKIVKSAEFTRSRIPIEVEDSWNWWDDMATSQEGKESPRYYFR